MHTCVEVLCIEENRLTKYQLKYSFLGILNKDCSIYMTMFGVDGEIYSKKIEIPSPSITPLPLPHPFAQSPESLGTRDGTQLFWTESERQRKSTAVEVSRALHVTTFLRLKGKRSIKTDAARKRATVAPDRPTQLEQLRPQALSSPGPNPRDWGRGCQLRSRIRRERQVSSCYIARGFRRHEAQRTLPRSGCRE